jgi:hypothetical protein
MSGPLPPLRNERLTPVRGVHTTASPRSGPATSGSDLDSEQQAQIAAQRQAFDFETAERAEILREHEALQTLLMDHLKNEDEIMKKWIALI